MSAAEKTISLEGAGAGGAAPSEHLAELAAILEKNPVAGMDAGDAATSSPVQTSEQGAATFQGGQAEASQAARTDGAGDALPAVAGSSVPASEEPVLYSLEEIAQLLEISITTARAWAHDPKDPMPCVAKGANGVAYQFDPYAVVAWFKARGERQAAEKRRKAEIDNQLRLEILGGDSVSADAAAPALSAAERINAVKLEVEAMKAAELRRELVRALEVKLGLQEVLRVLQQSLRAVPDRAAPKLGLSADQVTGLLEFVDAALEDAADGLQRITITLGIAEYQVMNDVAGSA